MISERDGLGRADFLELLEEVFGGKLRRRRHRVVVVSASFLLRSTLAFSSLSSIPTPSYNCAVARSQYDKQPTRRQRFPAHAPRHPPRQTKQPDDVLLHRWHHSTRHHHRPAPRPRTDLPQLRRGRRGAGAAGGPPPQPVLPARADRAQGAAL